MIEASQRMIMINSQGGERAPGEAISPAMKRHLELQIKTLQNTPRDEDKLQALLNT